MENKKVWKWVWGLIAAGVIMFISALDILAKTFSGTISTFSYLASYFSVRHPWVPFSIVGAFGHILLPHDAEPFFKVTSLETLNFILVVLIYGIGWEVARDLGYVRHLNNWLMFLNLNLALLAGYFVWPLRPTF